MVFLIRERFEAVIDESCMNIQEIKELYHINIKLSQMTDILSYIMHITDSLQPQNSAYSEKTDNIDTHPILIMCNFSGNRNDFALPISP